MSALRYAAVPRCMRRHGKGAAEEKHFQSNKYVNRKPQNSDVSNLGMVRKLNCRACMGTGHVNVHLSVVSKYVTKT